jgi:hypothetical protein
MWQNECLNSSFSLVVVSLLKLFLCIFVCVYACARVRVHSCMLMLFSFHVYNFLISVTVCADFARQKGRGANVWPSHYCSTSKRQCDC